MCWTCERGKPLILTERTTSIKLVVNYLHQHW